MCLILFAWQAHPRYPLVVAANRDEFHHRPTAAADFWDESPGLLAGRDIQAGGTWLGITRGGRFAAITNYREPVAPTLPLERSRGHLVRDFLLGVASPLDCAGQLQKTATVYRGFNLLLGDPGSLVYVSNRSAHMLKVTVGSHGLSNHLLDTDWPKVQAGRARLAALLQADEPDPEGLADGLLELLADRTLLDEHDPTGVENRPVVKGLAPEWVMRQNFIVSPIYGTRSSTVLLVDNEAGVQFIEREFDPAGSAIATRTHRFRVAGDHQI